MSTYHASYVDDLACRLADERTAVEIELIGSILSDPVRGVAEASRHGIDADLLEQVDLRAIYMAAMRACDAGKEAVLVLSRRLLRGLGLWDDRDTRSFARSMAWGAESLVSIACSHPFPGMVGVLAGRLRRIDARQRAVQRRFHEIVGLLDGSVESTADGGPRGRQTALFGETNYQKGVSYVFN